MLTKLLSLFKSEAIPKKVAFIDGDQALAQNLEVYDQYIKGRGIEAHFIRQLLDGHNTPKALNKEQYKDLNKIFLSGLSHGKEVVDKFIGAYIQKCVCEGYKEITVVSSDYDFIDIFKMASQIDGRASGLTFRLIVPNAIGKLEKIPEQMLNIEIIKPFAKVYNVN